MSSSGSSVRPTCAPTPSKGKRFPVTASPVIVSDRPLDTVVPLEPASMPGRTVVQWDKDDCEDLGIIKIDLLGLGMMAAIEETIVLCSQRGKEWPSIWLRFPRTIRKLLP